MRRYTKADLESMSDIELAISVVNERLYGLTNPYSILSERLKKAVRALEEMEAERKRRE